MHFFAIIIPTIDPGTDVNGNLVFEGAFVFLLLLNIAINIPVDIFSSWGMYRIAKRRNLPCPWMAWVPLGSLWTLGCIADQYRFEYYDRRGWSRWILLLLQIYLTLYFLAWFGVESLSVLLYELAAQYELACSVFLLTALLTIFRSLYRLYDSCRSNMSLLFTALSVLFSVPTPILIMLCARRDDDFLCD